MIDYIEKISLSNKKAFERCSYLIFQLPKSILKDDDASLTLQRLYFSLFKLIILIAVAESLRGFKTLASASCQQKKLSDGLSWPWTPQPNGCASHSHRLWPSSLGRFAIRRASLTTAFKLVYQDSANVRSTRSKLQRYGQCVFL